MPVWAHTLVNVRKYQIDNGQKESHTCLAFDLLIVSEIGFFFSLTAFLENRSTNSSKFIVGSSIFFHTSGPVFLKEK